MNMALSRRAAGVRLSLWRELLPEWASGLDGGSNPEQFPPEQALGSLASVALSSRQAKERLAWRRGAAP